MDGRNGITEDGDSISVFFGGGVRSIDTLTTRMERRGTKGGAIEDIRDNNRINYKSYPLMQDSDYEFKM